MHDVIRIHAEAPAKPLPGEPCNGCGVCCSSAPCPIGMLVSRRASGACAALVWQTDASRYRCGIIGVPAARLPRGLQWSAPLLDRLARRSVAAGAGCDCTLEVEGPAGGMPNA